MILTKPTEAEAYELADRCHAFLIANDEAYADSVAEGYTLQWAIPAQDEATGLWQVPVSERVYGCLTPEEYTPPAVQEVMEGRT